MRASFWIIGSVLSGLWACDPGTAEPTRIDWCEGPVRSLGQTVDAFGLTRFPDDLLRVTDPSSPTGYRVDPWALHDGWSDDWSELVQGALSVIPRRSGFSRAGGWVVRFEGEPGTPQGGGEEPAWGDDLLLVALEEEGPRLVSFSVVPTEDAQTLVVEPWLPLAPGTRHALVLRASHQAPGGGCVSPSRQERRLITGAAEVDPEGLHAGVVEQLGLSPEEISVLVVATTHDDARQIVQAREAALAAPAAGGWDLVCQPDTGGRRCEGTFPAWDLRMVEDVASSEPSTSWDVPVTVWLPAGDGPHPVVVYGHGIASDRTEAERVVEAVRPEGIAVVASQTPHHGDHPLAGDGDAAMVFLGVTLEPPSIDGQMLVRNFAQTSLERMQLTQLILADDDLDGDGVADLDTSSMAYVGASLGALLGVSVVALEEELSASVHIVGGGQLYRFVQDNLRNLGLEAVVTTAVGSEQAAPLFYTLLQTAADPVDPVLWGDHLVRGDFRATAVPDLLLPVAMDDEIIPQVGSEMLARSMHLPMLNLPDLPVAGLEPQLDGPWTANREGRTAGFYRYDVITREDGQVSAEADHWHTATSFEMLEQVREFLLSWAYEEHAVIVDPLGG